MSSKKSSRKNKVASQTARLSQKSFTPKDIEHLQRADQLAAEQGTPKLALQALMSPAKTFSGRKVYDMTLDTVIALELIESPFLKPSAKVGMLQIAEVMLLLTTPPEQVEALVCDRAAFTTAVREFARTVPLNEITTGQSVITGALNDAFSTSIPTGKPDESKKKGTLSPGN